MTRPYDSIRPIKWQDNRLQLMDQRLLPQQEVWLCIDTLQDTHDAIKNMVVRGAPAIGITAAYGAVLSARHHLATNISTWREGFAKDMQLLAQARPTAINLHWAVQRMRDLVAASNAGEVEARLLIEADEILQQDIEACYAMGDFGAGLISTGSNVLTHCNAGALATGGYGTALGVLRSAAQQQKLGQVFAGETRPWLQGTRLTAWELAHENINCKVIIEGAAASMMQQGKIQTVVVGADRVAANGDVANKIGTYSLAVLARAHNVRFIVAAPTSTIDLNCPSGADIPIEHRAPAEILSLGGRALSHPETEAVNPVFDVTPAEKVDFLVTEKGVIKTPNAKKIRALFA